MLAGSNVWAKRIPKRLKRSLKRSQGAESAKGILKKTPAFENLEFTIHPSALEERVMLQLAYMSAFSVIAFLAFGNLFRSLLMFGLESQRSAPRSKPRSPYSAANHPELFDDSGDVIDEPLLVMRSVTMEDAREQLDNLYDASPGYGDQARG